MRSHERASRARIVYPRPRKFRNLNASSDRLSLYVASLIAGSADVPVGRSTAAPTSSALNAGNCMTALAYGQGTVSRGYGNGSPL